MFGTKRIVWTGLFAGLFIVMFSTSAQAGFIDDIPDGLADQLEVSRTVAELIISCSILLSVGLVVAVASDENTSPLVMVVIMIAIIALLTSIQWLGPWLLIMICMIIALLYGSLMRGWAESRNSGG